MQTFFSFGPRENFGICIEPWEPCSAHNIHVLIKLTSGTPPQGQDRDRDGDGETGRRGDRTGQDRTGQDRTGQETT